MQNTRFKILAIESSCDDTSCAVLENNVVLSNVTAGQEVHKNYGGVVPELASRDHEKHLVPVVQSALKKSGCSLEEINAFAVTAGPGLMGSLLVGMSFAKSLSLSLGKPLISVNHMQAHILAHFISEDGKEFPEFPFLCLTVSGGHTQFVHVKSHLEFEIIGQTVDDAVGEAFDKAAKIMGLPYPGGPLMDQLAEKGDHKMFAFAHSKMQGNDMSFSGIKTSFLYFIREKTSDDPGFVERNLHHICASYRFHLIETLILKLSHILSQRRYSCIALAGGVSANLLLRRRFEEIANERSLISFIPRMEYCTDNAAMIGIAAYYKMLKGDYSELSITPKVRMGI